MNGLHEPPNRGEPIRAELIRQMLDYMRRITPVAGPNIKVSIGPGGAKIEGTPGGEVQAEALAPWTVRRHVTEGDAAGQWEIWLPPGCMSVGGDCTPLNKPASEKAGHEDDAADWYALDLDETGGSPTRTATVENEDGEQVTVYIRKFPIIAHAKTSAKVAGVDELDAPARRLLYVSARKTPPEDEQETADSGADFCGDEFSQLVGEVTVTVGGGKTSRRIVSRCKTTISVAGRERTNFDLVWYFEFDENELKLRKVYCVRQQASAAGISITGDTMTDILSNGGDVVPIYARIDVTDLSNGGGIVQVLKDPQEVSSASPYVVWLHLYDLLDNSVVADYRYQSLTNLQLYHA